MSSDLGTTNLLLGIMAFVSVLQGLVVVAAGLTAFLLYRKVMRVVAAIEERQITPAAARVNAILDDVKAMTSSIREEYGRIMGLFRRGSDLFRRTRRDSSREHHL